MSIAQELARNRQLYLRRQGGAQAEALPVAAVPFPRFAGGTAMAKSQTAPMAASHAVAEGQATFLEARVAEPFAEAEAPRRFSLGGFPLRASLPEDAAQSGASSASAEVAAPVFAGDAGFAEALPAKESTAVGEVVFPQPPARGNRLPGEDPLDTLLERMQMDARRYPADLDEEAR